jgi:hypothetical protein
MSIVLVVAVVEFVQTYLFSASPHRILEAASQPAIAMLMVLIADWQLRLAIEQLHLTGAVWYAGDGGHIDSSNFIAGTSACRCSPAGQCSRAAAVEAKL